ncbi:MULTISPECIES: DUF3784 domain-containing protein [unclassified Clostridioides]|uniref:DUF3784 domain-containing protein n=1 Tax=unclassified Clostridioides TaxID=2635829 RepID=UPI001D0C79F4|nr:DUF3784 domain-containing protein [Clostridioides sp. ES-S-0001-02]MCC0638643.1 DUF3784 domain-containing protein [Clostridioides sp. ES-S-0049-03]MCC0652519.1 DUF3784 domain-containing protein [Clostridioides sp. ES-S-0001-03]MCC0655193.1 DUF3784 domain-containing protein [Clostridioides sp. ES-S-0123-01]MCC0673009.1 DUF3784 domain-containing protein [Clostridioides sp. ES-S-0145-01]MCC0675031.1 DUF3784 domain-containing protein [Clostridioides sp. ES-W-0018-02]MCC0695217.1 DUF3784 domain
MFAVGFTVIIAIASFILSILLFNGKASMLLAGYNTMSDKEKARYDVKKLCRSSSIVTFIVSIMLFIMSFLGYRIESGQMDEKKMLPFAVIFIIVILASVFFNIYYSNKKCKK